MAFIRQDLAMHNILRYEPVFSAIFSLPYSFLFCLLLTAVGVIKGTESLLVKANIPDCVARKPLIFCPLSTNFCIMVNLLQDTQNITQLLAHEGYPSNCICGL